MELPNFLLKRAFLTPNRQALSYEGQTYTFQQLLVEAKTVAGKLTAIGIKEKQRVGVLLKNEQETIFLLLALQLLRAETVLLNNRLTEHELIWQLNDANVAFLIIDKKNEALKSTWNEEKVIIRDQIEESAYVEPAIVETVDSGDICTIMYTSGTTGFPKGVMQTYGNHWWSATGSALNLGLHEQDAWLLAVPLFHISGYSIMMRSLIYGMKVVLLPAFDEKKVIAAIETEKVTIMSVVQTMLVRIIASLGEQQLPSTFRCMLLGGGPAPKPLLEACVEKGIPVYQTYGMTETSSQIVTLSPEDALTKLGSAGKPLFPAQLKIVDEKRVEVQAGTAGEIIVKGPNVTLGYLNRADATAEAIIDHWLYTGDIGYVDEEGFLYVLDRRSDLIISGGENIYPAEIEAALLAHHAIADAAVVGMKDKKWGEVPVAFIVVNEVVAEDDLHAHCAGRLAKYKCPAQFFYVDDIPRNAAKKIMRRTLRARLESEE